MADDCNKITERLAKLEVRADHTDGRIDTHQSILFKLDNDIKELSATLGEKIEKSHEVTMRAMDSIPPWLGKVLLGIVVSLALGAFGIHYFHV